MATVVGSKIIFSHIFQPIQHLSTSKTKVAMLENLRFFCEFWTFEMELLYSRCPSAGDGGGGGGGGAVVRALSKMGLDKQTNRKRPPVALR